MPDEFRIPARLNLALSLLSVAGCLALLVAASHAPTLWLRIVAVGGFALLGNTVFSLLHEAVHRLLHPDRKLNDVVGMVLAAMFPTSLAFQRACHLGHHRRNRTDAELFDQYRPGDSRFLKSIQFYGIFTGFYWPIVPLGCALIALFPWLPRRLARMAKGARDGGEQTGTVAMLAGVASASRWRIRLEAVFALALHGALVATGLVDWRWWLASYLAFGWAWGTLQYADHAFSVRDVREGAWNLGVSRATRWIFLNYHLHLNHHRRPDVPWIHLPALTTESDPAPSFWSIYRRMWRGPVAAVAETVVRPDASLENVLGTQA